MTLKRLPILLTLNLNYIPKCNSGLASEEMTFIQTAAVGYLVKGNSNAYQGLGVDAPLQRIQ